MGAVVNLFARVCGFVSGLCSGPGSGLTRTDLKRLEPFHTSVEQWPGVEEDLFESDTFGPARIDGPAAR